MAEIESSVQTKETQRLEAFSDGVFAIAITLLVLEIRLPTVESDFGLFNRLLSLWPAYFAYLISFVTIGIMWANHDALLRDIKRSDRAFVLLNALLLMLITFLNFPTAVLSEYLVLPDANIAAMFYSGTLFFIAVLFNGLWLYAAANNRLLDKNTDPQWRDRVTRQYRFGPLFYLVSFVVASFSPLLSLGITLVLALYFALTGRQLARLYL